MFEKEKVEDVYRNPDIPFEIVRKGKKSSLRDKRTGLLVVSFAEHSFYNDTPGERNISNEFRFHEELDGRIIIFNNSSDAKSVLIIDNKVRCIKQGCHFNFFSMNPNLNYICIQDLGSEKKSEWIMDVNTLQDITPRFISIYPAAKFPQVGIYKAHTKEGDAIYSWPDNKQLTKPQYGFTSMGFGYGQGTSIFYSTQDEYGREKFYEMWDIPFLHGVDSKIVQQIVGEDFKVRLLNHHDVIKRIFKMKFKK